MRRTTWILWLMLALLPLRSWAVTGMGMPQGVVGAAGITASMSAKQSLAFDHATPPCHQGAGMGDGPSPDGGKCQACDWCHAALGLAPRVSAASAPLPSDPPAALAARDTGRAAVSGLERPPRAPPA